jgi:hypothetical protein
MGREKGSAVLLITVLVVSVALLTWSVVSTWQPSKDSSTTASIMDSAKAEGLPPRVGSDEAKASLFYPVMKSRGPQPGGKLVVRPIDGPRGP